MNFSTDLPKGNPIVSYIVASAVNCEGAVIKDPKPSFRMHAVILKNKRNFIYTVEDQAMLNDGKGLILCHVRKVSDEDSKISPKLKRQHKECINSPLEFNSEPIIEKEDMTIDKRVILNEMKIKTYCGEYKEMNFANSKRIMKVIGEHMNESYTELYVLLFGNID